MRVAGCVNKKPASNFFSSTKYHASRNPPSSRQHGHEMPQFLLQFMRPGHGLGNFGAEQFAIALAHAVNGRPHGALGQVELRGGLRVRRRLLVRQ